MSLSQHTVLVTALDEYDAAGGPVSVESIAGAVSADPSRVRPVVAALSESEFLAETAEGYRPTVTARELLDLDIELDDVVAVDPVEESSQHDV